MIALQKSKIQVSWRRKIYFCAVFALCFYTGLTSEQDRKGAAMHTHTELDLIYRQERLSTLHQQARLHNRTSHQTPVRNTLWTLWCLWIHRGAVRN